MDRCPRCGTAVSPYVLVCPRCGLRRGTGQDNVAPWVETSAPPPPPRPVRATAIAVAVLVAVLAIATAGGLWLVERGPFAPAAAAGVSTPGAAPTTVTASVTASPAETSAPSQVPEDFSAVYGQVASGVGLISVQTCTATFSGSGFLVGPTTVVTAAHVVDGATEVEVQFDAGPVTARVSGVDQALDLAVLTLSSGTSGHVFDMASGDPEPGTHIAVIGYPLDEPKSLTEGTISGVNREITTDTGTLGGLLQTDAAINPGNSGGPLVNGQGEIVGIADAIRLDAQGIGFAVPMSQARDAVETGAGLTAPATPACLQPRETVRSDVKSTLQAYLDAINAGDYDAAMSLVSDKIRNDGSAQQWTADYATTYDDRLRIRSTDTTGAMPHVWATFRSQQLPGYGPAGAKGATCLIWSVDYTMDEQTGDWIIADARAHGDPAWTRCD